MSETVFVSALRGDVPDFNSHGTRALIAFARADQETLPLG
jgi:hypothetical protein